MANPGSLRVGDINLTSGKSAESAEVDPEAPFRILVLGNFSGPGQKAKVPVGQRKPLLIDRDNFDDVWAKIGPTVNVPLGPNLQEQVDLSFRTLEDFEPEQLFQRVRVFEKFAELRRRLRDPARFAAAADEIKGWAGAAKNPTPAAPGPVSPENLLEQMLGDVGSQSAPAPLSDWDRFLHQIVAPHAVARTDPRLPDFEAVVDEAISAQMRSLMHHADFQALEAAWRGLFFLVRRLETDATLKLYILDVTREELTEDVVGKSDLSTTGMYAHLVERTVGTSGGQPWAVVVGTYTLVLDQDDVEMLANLAKIVGRAGAPFLMAAHSRVLGCASLVNTPDPRQWQDDPAFQETWNALRQLPEARYLGLALPRFLLRLPYGKDSASTEQFSFEELPPGSPHDHYLWGNPALACALLLGESFTQSGWDLRPGDFQEIDGLPVALYREEDETVSKPCAEVVLTDRAVEAILDRGLMPLVSPRDRPTIRVARFRSVTGAPLAGRWS